MEPKMLRTFTYDGIFTLEGGQSLERVEIAYETYGQLNANKDNVVWVCHALTANAAAIEWWPGVVGENTVLDPAKYFIVCANILGSCYGTTGPLSINPSTGKPYYYEFPGITIRDMVKAHIALKKELGIDHIFLLAGGSMGGYQALEWCMMEPDAIENLFLIATSASETAWGIAVHEAQRIAIEADDTWQENHEQAGSKGLKAARAIGMLTYRNYRVFKQQQTDTDLSKLDHFKAASYMNYQGDKLVKRFNAFSYRCLTKAMDTHNIARGRTNMLSAALQEIRQHTFIIGIESDLLCPTEEQQLIASHIRDCSLLLIDSDYGHDGFLTESAAINEHLQEWLFP